jgi:hypothetical protein
VVDVLHLERISGASDSHGDPWTRLRGGPEKREVAAFEFRSVGWLWNDVDPLELFDLTIAAPANPDAPVLFEFVDVCCVPLGLASSDYTLTCMRLPSGRRLWPSRSF